MKAVAGLLKNPKLSNEAIQAGKSQLKLQVLSEADEGSSLAESIAAQGFYTGQAKSPADIAKEIDAVSTNDIASVSSLMFFLIILRRYALTMQIYIIIVRDHKVN